MIKNQLEINGIQSFLINENFSNLMPHMFGILGSGVQVLVNGKDLDQAQKIIGLKDQVTCPNCGSNEVSNLIKRRKGIAFLIAILFSGPIGNLLGDYKCDRCGTEFRR